MIYLTGRKLLDDESDNEDPCAQLNIPADNLKENVDSSGDSEDGVYPTNNTFKKFIVEITDQDRIKQLLQEQSPTFGRNYPDAVSSGAIKQITDIPNFKKLLLATVPL